ncbi:MAG: T9SS type A sorting domain-containing protein, partial [Bacteroidales bacterium]|nr:T9SS type A sorting domain-containing protein [Bacteroidales bacterium]
NNTISKTLSIQSDNDSLLNKYTYKIQNISQDYYTGVQVTNNSGSDLVAGDSIKVLLKINGTNIYVSKITLTKSIQKDSSTYCLLNDYVIVPNISQWGENTYCYQVVYYNENPVNDNPTNNCMTFTFNKTTGIVENALEEVKIYPNPARNILYINNVENANIDIYSIAGQRVKTIKNVTGNQDIDVSDMANGMYILRMQDGQNTRVEKIQVIK